MRINFTMNLNDLQALSNWLYFRENDIANDIEDLGSLRGVFKEVLGHNAGLPRSFDDD